MRIRVYSWVRPDGTWVAMFHQAGYENIESTGTTRAEAVENVRDLMVADKDHIIAAYEHDAEFREEYVEI